MKKHILLIFFFTVLFLMYSKFYFLVYIFLLPLFFYLKNTKKLNLKLISIIIIIYSALFFIYFKDYGYKFLIITIFYQLIFYISLIISSNFLIKRKNYVFSIPFAFYIIFFIYKFLPLNNFWLNYSGLLPIYPKTISILGSYFHTFTIILFNTLLFYLITEFKTIKKTKTKTNKIPKKYIAYSILTIILLFNFFLINFLFQEEKIQSTIKVAAIQPDINQNWQQRYSNSRNNFEILQNLSLEAIEKYNPQIIIWPEYIFTHPLMADKILLEALNIFSNEKNITLILGSILHENNSVVKSKRFNTLYIFNNNNLNYYKAYEPVLVLDNNAAKAKENSPIIINNVSFGFGLCYEENFPKLYSKSVKENNASILFTIGNQYYINNYIGLKLTSLNSNLRAAENNRYLLRLETSGLSTVIDNNGKNIKEIPINKKGILYYEMPLIEKKTFYSLYGIYIDYSIFIISIIYLLLFPPFLALKNNKN